MTKRKLVPIRIILIGLAILALATPTYAQREVDPAGPPSDEQAMAGLPHGTVTVNTRTRVSVGLQQMEEQADSNLARIKAQVTRAGIKPDPDGPNCWTDGTKICVGSRYALAYHWNHANGSDGLPRVAMRPVGDHYEVNLGAIPAEDFTFGFVNANQSDGVRETKWLPGNVGSFKQGSPWVIPHTENPGADFLMKSNGQRMWVANPDEVAAFRRAKLAGK